MRVSDWIKENRIRMKMTQEELGKKTHVVRQTISMYETGKRTPDYEFVIKAAEIFGVDVNQLSEILKEDNTGEDEKVNLFDKLSNESAVKWIMLCVLQGAVIIFHLFFLRNFTKTDYWRFGTRVTLYRLFVNAIIPLLFSVFGNLLGKLLAYYEVRLPDSYNKLIKVTAKVVSFICVLTIITGYLSALYYGFEVNQVIQWRHETSFEVFVSHRWILYPIIVVSFATSQIKETD